MTSREQFLNDYEISHLVCDSEDSKDDRHSDDDFGLSGSEDEEDTVEEDLDNIDSMCDFADTDDHGEPENTDNEPLETGESIDEKTNVFQGKEFTWSRTPPKFARARRENTTVRLLGCVDEAKNANTPHDAFSLLFLMRFRTLYLHTPIKKFVIISSASLARFRNGCGEHHWMNFVLSLVR